VTETELVDYCETIATSLWEEIETSTGVKIIVNIIII